MGELSNLPDDLLPVIVAFLDEYRDYVQFRSSSSWLRNRLPKWPNHLHYPCLMLPCDGDDEEEEEEEEKKQAVQGFYNVLKKEIEHYELPESRQRHCVGCSDGWLVTLEKGKLNLLNPVNHSQIPLPHISTFPNIRDYDPNRTGKEYSYIHNPDDPYHCHLSQDQVFPSYIIKIVLSFSSPNDFIAVAIYGGDYGHLAFTKFGHQNWTHIPAPTCVFRDCIFSDGLIYALNIDAELVISSIHNPTRIVTYLNSLIQYTDMSIDYLYLVKTDDHELLMVEKVTLDPEQVEEEEEEEEDLSERPPPSNYATYGFNLYKLDSNQTSWVPIYNLDAYAIFLGLNTSICISSTYWPNLFGNRIYYSDDQQKHHTQGFISGHDFGVFNISNGSLQRILYEERPLRLLFWPQPIWVMLKCC